MEVLKDICEKQFQLVHYSGFSYEELDNMTIHEREMLYGFLIKIKTEEAESISSTLSNLV